MTDMDIKKEKLGTICIVHGTLRDKTIPYSNVIAEKKKEWNEYTIEKRESM